MVPLEQKDWHGYQDQNGVYIPIDQTYMKFILALDTSKFIQVNQHNFSIICAGKINIQIFQGDLVNEKTDAITNAANEDLLLGSGVAGAISQAGGPAIQQECDEIYRRFGKVPVGGSVPTKAGMLPFKCIVHTVGPYYHKYNNQPDSANKLL